MSQLARASISEFDSSSWNLKLVKISFIKVQLAAYVKVHLFLRTSFLGAALCAAERSVGEGDNTYKSVGDG